MALSDNTEKINQLLAAINGLPNAGEGGGVTLPTLDDPGTADDLCWGKELIDGDGKKVIGTFELLPVDFAETAFFQENPCLSRRITPMQGSILRKIFLKHIFPPLEENSASSRRP